MSHPLGFTDEQATVYDRAIAKYRGNLKVKPNGTLYDHRTGDAIDLKEAPLKSYAYQVCVYGMFPPQSLLNLLTTL